MPKPRPRALNFVYIYFLSYTALRFGMQYLGECWLRAGRSRMMGEVGCPYPTDKLHGISGAEYFRAFNGWLATWRRPATAAGHWFYRDQGGSKSASNW